MSLIRFILWSLIFYLVFRTIRNVINALSPKKNTQPQNKMQSAPSKYKIEKDDVIDADFEEIKNSDKSKDKS